MFYEVSLFGHIIGIMPLEDANKIRKWNNAICVVPFDMSKRGPVSLSGNVYQCFWNDCELGEMGYDVALTLKRNNGSLEFYPVQDLEYLKEEYERDLLFFGPEISWEWEDVVEDFYYELESLGLDPREFVDIKGGFDNCYDAHMDQKYVEEYLR